MKLSDLVGLKEPYAFAENVLANDLENIEKALGWDKFPLNYGRQAIISCHDFYISFDTTFKWIISNDDTSAKVVVESEIKAIKGQHGGYEDVHLCIDGEIWTGYDLGDALRNFMDDCDLYDPYTAVQAEVIDDSEIDYYYNEPQKYVSQHYGINRYMPRKQFKASCNFQSFANIDNLITCLH